VEQLVARRAHNPKVAGSSPVPATKKPQTLVWGFFILNIFFIMKMYFVYVLKSKEGFHYTGMSEDLEKRVKEHNNKSLSFWTKRGTDWKVIFQEDYELKSEALKREKWLKTGVGREFLEKNVNDY
jgi:putative endonuclease